MTKWIDSSGRTEDDAIAAGLKTLGLDRDDVSVEVLERARSGFFGLGASPAVVRLRYEAPDEPQTSAAAPAGRETGPAPSPRPPIRRSGAVPVQGGAAAPSAHSAPDAGPVDSEQYARVESFVSGLLERMGVRADISVTQREGGVTVSLNGADMGAVIGHGGETLDAIQRLTNYAVNRGAGPRLRVSVDAENYRQKREDTLVKLAERTAAKAVKYRRSMALEPMNSYERHVIHTALQNYPDVSTGSTGVEPRRRVVVSYTKGDAGGQNHSHAREWD